MAALLSRDGPSRLSAFLIVCHSHYKLLFRLWVNHLKDRVLLCCRDHCLFHKITLSLKIDHRIAHTDNSRRATCIHTHAAYLQCDYTVVSLCIVLSLGRAASFLISEFICFSVAVEWQTSTLKSNKHTGLALMFAPLRFKSWVAGECSQSRKLWDVMCFSWSVQKYVYFSAVMSKLNLRMSNTT